MQEEMNSAMAQLNETVGDDVPTLAEVAGEDRGPLRQGQGRRRAQRDVGRVTVLEVEQATANVEAQSRLSELRAELGLERRQPPGRRARQAGRPAAGRRAADRLTAGRLTRPSVYRHRSWPPGIEVRTPSAEALDGSATCPAAGRGRRGG